MIKAIIFDMGGVLVNLDKQRCIDAYKRLGFDQIEDMLDSAHQRGFFADMESGQITGEQFCDKCLEYCHPGTTRQDIIDAFAEFIPSVSEDAARAVNVVAGPYPRYILSNNNPIAVAISEKLLNARGIHYEDFTGLFFSYRMKMLKPDLAFYAAAIDGVGLPAEEILFVDDAPANIAAANQAGLQTLLYVPGTCLSAALEEKLCELNA